MATPKDIAEAKAAAAARRKEQSNVAAQPSSLESIATQLQDLLNASKTRQTTADADLKAAQEAKVQAQQAKKDAATALMQATGTRTLADAQKAAAAKDVSKNPAVVQTQKELAAAKKAEEDAKRKQQEEANKKKDTGGSNVTPEKKTYTAPDGRIFTDLNEYNDYITKLKQEEKTRQGQSAFNLLFDQFNQYGMGALVEPLKALIVEGLSPAEFTLRLRETDAYKKRFAANASRIQKGLRALSEAEYIGLEDQYQNVMRRYGLPETYYTRGDMGRQEGFEKFLAGDVSPVELEDRIQLAQNRVIKAAPEIAATLRTYYPDITNGDILAYVLDPQKAITEIQRKVTAAEIGGAATMAGLTTGVSRAEQLASYGITGEAARQGYAQVAEVLPRGSQLAEFYKQSPYTQQTAEQEVFNLAGGTEAARQRKKITQLETAAFSGQAGVAGGALARERAGGFQAC